MRAGQYEFVTTTEGRTVHSCDDGNVEIFQRGKSGLRCVRQGLSRLQVAFFPYLQKFLYVRTGNEGVSRTRYD